MLSFSIPARAARPHDVVALEYRPSPATAARCPAADFLREEVQIRIGYDLFQPSQPEASPRLTVKIDRLESEYRVSGELRSEEGSVTLAGTFTEVECGAAIRSLAIAVAIRFTHPPEACPLPRPAAPTPAPPGPASPTLAPSPQAPSRPDPFRFQIGIVPTVAFGAAPVVVGGASSFFGIRWPVVSAAIGARVLFAPSATVLGPSPRPDYHFLVTAVTAAGCVHPAWALACVQAEWSSISFSRATIDVDPDYLSHLNLGFRLGGELALTRAVALRADVEASFNLDPGTLRTTMPGAPAIWHEPILSCALSFGPVMTF